MYIEKKKIGNKLYNYLKVSVRVGDTVKTKTVAYLGTGDMDDNEISKKIKKIPKTKIESAKKKLKNLSDINSKFLTPEQLNSVREIKSNFNKKVKKIDKKLYEDMFKDFKTYYIYNTNAIEGNTLTLEETNLLLNKGITPDSKDLREIYDHIDASKTFDYLLKNKPEITPELMIEIHSMLLKNQDKRVGGFRNANVRVFGASLNTTDAKYIYTDIKLLMKWYNENKRGLHPLILSAIFHEKFERIHPFFDGNGRTGRMMLNLILLKYNLPPIIIKNKDRKEYYHVLDLGHKADLTKTDELFYKEIVKFCYNKFIETYAEIFAKWG